MMRMIINLDCLSLKERDRLVFEKVHSLIGNYDSFDIFASVNGMKADT